jgi:hypothetical protein
MRRSCARESLNCVFSSVAPSAPRSKPKRVLLTEPERRSPRSIGAVVDLAFAGYAGDVRFYVALALAAFAIQAAIALPLGTTPAAAWWLQGANLMLDAFIAGCVSVGVAARIFDEPLSPRIILRRILHRWWAIVLVDLIVWLIRLLTFEFVFGGLEATGYYTLVLPTLLLWGGLLSADVIASIDDHTPLPALPGLALLQSVMLSWRPSAMLRVLLLSAMTIPALMIPMVLDDVLRLHGIPLHEFWSEIPVDAVLIGPYQALFTVFYFDLRNRAAG